MIALGVAVIACGSLCSLLLAAAAVRAFFTYQEPEGVPVCTIRPQYDREADHRAGTLLREIRSGQRRPLVTNECDPAADTSGSRNSAA